MEITVPVDVPLVGDERHKNWAKVVEDVDASKGSGWAFEGDFIAAGGIQDVPAGSVVLVYGERGSRANPVIQARVYTANPDGTLSIEATASGRAWARTLRDRIVELLGDDRSPVPLAWGPELAAYTDDAILQEAHRRSLTP